MLNVSIGRPTRLLLCASLTTMLLASCGGGGSGDSMVAGADQNTDVSSEYSAGSGSGSTSSGSTSSGNGSQPSQMANGSNSNSTEQAAPTAPAGPVQQVSYSSSNAQITNPERGFYVHGGDCNVNAFDANSLKNMRTSENMSLVICPFYLRGATNSAISQGTLDFFQRQMDTIRNAGMKTIVRFGYSDDTSGADANASRIAQHLDQLKPYLDRNKDVIAVVQAGFIGGWGEWAYSQNFGDVNSLSTQNWNDRKQVFEKVLQAVPAERSVMVRYNMFKSSWYGTAPVSAAEAFNGSAKARIGHQNDCFLASADDWGTWRNKGSETPYVAADTQYVPMGGESCNYAPPRSDCPTALQELAQFHWSFINSSYHQSVVNAWKSQGCYNQVKQKLGYRIALQSGEYSGSAKAGGAFAVKLNLQNQGWAAPFNARKVELVLRNTASGALHRVALKADPRTWLAGKSVTVEQTVTLPAGMAAGNYALYLALPDPMPSLANRAEYAIQLANNNVWDANTGLNNLNHTVSIGS